MIALLYAHPHPARSRANRVLLDAARTVPGITVRSLYDTYPDFDIDVAAERRLLADTKLIVWQHPLMWYSAPALMKLWFDSVLAHGWAYGEGGTALAGKSCLWVTTTGAPPDDYSPAGKHQYPFEAFTPLIEMTARYCHMHWLAPIIVHGAHLIDDATLQNHAAQYRDRLISFTQEADRG
ncbi:MAG: glutathione-regulated potassium-efflux system oxidoreductase KefF [Burkholderiales bacterium]